MPKKCRWLLEFMAQAAVLLAGAMSTAKGGEAEDPAVAAARKRQATARTLDVEYEVKEVYAKGALSHAASQMFWESVGGRPVPIDGIETRIDQQASVGQEQIAFRISPPVARS